MAPRRTPASGSSSRRASRTALRYQEEGPREKPFNYNSRLSTLREIIARSQQPFKIVSTGFFRRRHAVVGPGQHGKPITFLSFDKNNIAVHHFTGGLLAIRAGMAVGENGEKIAKSLIHTIISFNSKFGEMLGHRLLYDHERHEFLAHASDMNEVMDFRRKLSEPFRSFVKPQVYLTNDHPSNKLIAREILNVFPNPILKSEKNKPRLSVAAVQRDDGLHVSLHQEPPHREDFAVPTERIGASLWQMEQRMPKSLIDALKKLHVKKLYLLSTTGLLIRKVIDLDQAQDDVRFVPPE